MESLVYGRREIKSNECFGGQMCSRWIKHLLPLQGFNSLE